MSDLVIKEPFASRIREVAQENNLTPQELIAIMLERYERQQRRASIVANEVNTPPNQETRIEKR